MHSVATQNSVSIKINRAFVIGLKCWHKSDLNIITIPLLHLVGWKIYHWHTGRQSTVMEMGLWRWDEGVTIKPCIHKPWTSKSNLTDFVDLEDMKLFKLFRGQRIHLDDRKDQYFCGLSIIVGAKQQIPCSVSFLLQWEDCFFHQGQRQVTNWAVAVSPIPSRPPPSCILLNHPPTHKLTHICTHGLALTQTSAH